jgi:hypothetical protein
LKRFKNNYYNNENIDKKLHNKTTHFVHLQQLVPTLLSRPGRMRGYVPGNAGGVRQAYCQRLKREKTDEI